jgi:hypothetical protein
MPVPPLPVNIAYHRKLTGRRSAFLAILESLHPKRAMGIIIKSQKKASECIQ